MKMEEAMSSNLVPDVALLNAVLAKISTNPFLNDPNEGPEFRLGELIALYFRGGDIGGFLTCMEIAFRESLLEVTGPKPCEDPVIGNCRGCYRIPGKGHLRFWEEEAWDVCYNHRTRWLIGKSLYCVWRIERGRILDKLAEQDYYFGDHKESDTGHPEDSKSQQEEPSEISKEWFRPSSSVPPPW